MRFPFWRSVCLAAEYRAAEYSARPGRILAEAKLFFAWHGTPTSTPERPARLRGVRAPGQLRGRGRRAARLRRGGEPAGSAARTIPGYRLVPAPGARPHAHRSGP